MKLSDKVSIVLKDLEFFCEIFKQDLQIALISSAMRCIPRKQFDFSTLTTFILALMSFGYWQNTTIQIIKIKLLLLILQVACDLSFRVFLVVAKINLGSL